MRQAPNQTNAEAPVIQHGIPASSKMRVTFQISGMPPPSGLVGITWQPKIYRGLEHHHFGLLFDMSWGE